MSAGRAGAGPVGGRPLRVLAIVLVPTGLGLHLWLGSRVGLALAAVGALSHLAAGVLGRRWLRGRQR
ncbi:hypothetical protein GCM10009665_17160 [Kitasatospora nipponensis]|uniref:Uncharacterized protein n=1 Tax=Kitasatospora nipponensis TaxID=258049 RepID=A0ABN1W185_9ACTN